MRQLLALVLIAATPALAADAPMTAAEFEAYATGKTLTYAVGGEVYGAEQYLPGRRVLWAFKGRGMPPRDVVRTGGRGLFRLRT